MGFLFDSYMYDMPNDKVLARFRTGVTNTYITFYGEMLDDKERFKEIGGELLSSFVHKNVLLGRKFIISIFNEIGCDIKNIKLQKDCEDIVEENFYHYLIEDFWEFVQGLDNENFYGVMVYLTQTNTTNIMINRLKQAVKDELLRNRISVRELRKSVFIAMSFASENN